MKKLLFMLAALGSISGFAQEKDALRVKPVVGEAVTFLFETKPEVSFVPTGLRITGSSTDPVAFNFDEIEFMDFVSISGTADVELSDITLRVTPQAFIIDSAPQGSSLSVYSLDGRAVLNATFSDNYTIDRSRLAGGVYIIRINKSTFKVSNL